METATEKELKGEISGLADLIKQKHAEFAKELETAKKDGLEFDKIKNIAVKAEETLETLLGWQKKAQDQLDALDIKSQAKGTIREKSFNDLLIEGLMVHKDRLSQIKGDSTIGGLKLDVKAAATMLISTNYSGGTVGLTSWDNTFTPVVRRDPFLRQLFNVRPVSGMYIAWAEQANRDGAADTVAEGATKPLVDFDIVEASKKVEKIAARAKASKEMMDDIPYFVSELNQELVYDVNIKLDSQLYDGNGTTPNLKGIKTYATTLSVAGLPFATGVQTPNRADVLFVAAAVVKNNLFNPNYALVNPLDVAMMMLDKDTQGNGLTRAYVGTDGGLYVGNMRIVENTGVPVGEFVVGDFTKAILGIREEVNIQVGYENDDFSKNLVTVIAELRAVSYVKTNHLNAFVKGSFATVITAITKP